MATRASSADLRPFAGLLLVALGAGGACQGPPDLRSERSAHIILSHPEDAPVCDGTVAYLERSAMAQAALLEAELGTIHYVAWHPADWAAGPCPSAGGCTLLPERVIHAPWPDLTHELVHAIHRPTSVKLLEEGLAVALSDSESHQAAEWYDPSIAELLDGDRLDFADYAEAGDFVSYLIAREGPHPVVAAARSLPLGTPADARAALFAEALGRSVEDAERERWQTGWRFQGGDLELPRCTAEPIAWEGARFSLPVDCHAGGIGYDFDTLPFGAVNYTRRHATVEILEEGVHRLDVAQGRRGVWLDVEGCPLAADPLEPYEAFHMGTPWLTDYTAFAYLRRGRYSVSGWAAWPEPGRIDATVLPAAPSCQQPVPITGPPSPLFLLAHPSTPLEVAIVPSVDLILSVDALRRSGVSVCPECGACTVLAERDVMPLAGGVPVLLRVAAEVWGAETLLSFARAPLAR